MSAEAQRIEAIWEVAVAVSSTLDIDQVLGVILTRACELLAARHGSIMLLEEAGAALTIAAAHGLADDVVANTRVPLGEGIAGGVAESGRSRVLAAGSREREGRVVHLPAAVCVPLSAHGRVIGVLNLSDRTDGQDSFADDDVRLVELLAAQSAVAITNARAYQEQEHRAAELRALYEVSLAVNESLSLEETLGRVLSRAIELLGAHKGSVMLLDAPTAQLSIAVAHGLSDEVIASTRVGLGEGIAGEVARSGEPRRLAAGVRVADSHSEARALPAALCVPLTLSGTIIGVLNVSERSNGGNFSAHDQEVLLALGTQAALAIHNARLYDGLSQRAEALAALNVIGQALSTTLQRDELLTQVLDSALRLLSCDKGSLMLIVEPAESDEFDPTPRDDGTPPDTERHLHIVVARGLPREVVESTRIGLGEGIAGGVALSGQRVVLNQGQVAEGSQSAQRSASLCLPLIVKERVIGVLNLSEHQGGDFREDQIELAVTLAAQAAAAIENAQLYDDLEEQFVHSIRVIANAIDARDPYTRGHSERVARLSRMIGELLGLDEEECDKLYNCGLLHDVGKIGIRDDILLKQGKLTDDEFHVMQSHPVKSAEILYPVKQLRGLLPGMRHHHERYSSFGYPDGLHEEDIPLMARIIGVADTYDAMTSSRPYRQALPRRVALEELLKNSGLQFDPRCVTAFMTLVGEIGIGHIDGQGDDGAGDVAAARAALGTPAG
ncbi:MAG: GAF domain-containing protein [Armatimonadetes bacterium]|nr:GAF domain-containing protein [Armatimonadota bacterium]